MMTDNVAIQWKKMQQGRFEEAPKISEIWTWQYLVDELGMTKSQAKKRLRELDLRLSRQEFWANDIYRAEVDRRHSSPLMHDTNLEVGDVIEIAITRWDKEAIHDWRHFQRIKNDILGEEVEACELYPRESRLLDTANTYWMYAFPYHNVLNFGHVGRAVEDGTGTLGAVQRPLG